MPNIPLGWSLQNGFQQMANQLKLMTDLKAGVPRGAYKSVVFFRYKLNRVFLVADYPTYQLLL